MIGNRQHPNLNEWILIENGWEEEESSPIALFREERKKYSWFDSLRDIVVSDAVQQSKSPYHASNQRHPRN